MIIDRRSLFLIAWFRCGWPPRDGDQHMVFTQFLAPEEYAEVFDDVRNLAAG